MTHGIARRVLTALALAGGVAMMLSIDVTPLAAQATNRGGARPATTPARPDSMMDPLARALEAEDKNDLRAASVAYREAILRAMQGPNIDGDKIAFALLGLERSWVETGGLDSLVPVVTRVIQVRPTDPVARGIQLRTLVALGRDDEARAAFTQWRRNDPGEGQPFREYARLLMQQGRTRAADSLLQQAAQLLGPAGALSGETAQLHVALGRWNAAAIAYREALRDQPYLETAALFGLTRAPAASRDSIRLTLLAPPILLAPRRLLSQLEFSWSEPRRAWQSISAVKADDSTAAAWRAFGERAELNESWLVARDAWTAVFEKRGDLESQRRAADMALRAGDAAGALALARRSGQGDATARSRALLPLEIAALADQGQLDEARKLLDKQGTALDANARAALSRPLIGAMLRAGDLARARTAMQDGDLADDDELAGVLALYEGDLATARKRLVRTSTQRGDLVDALGILARVRVDHSPALGGAFLLLARRDSAAASEKFALLADSVGTAAPALLAQAARLRPAARAVPIWERIVRDYTKSPEAPEALLAWARHLLALGDKPGATVKLEQMLVDYPNSALAPQARRELDRLKGQVPPSPAI